MLIRTYTGVSLDGFMAAPDGSPAWDAMPGFTPGESYDFRAFIAQCEAIVVGRATFDFGHAYWAEQSIWPWEGSRVYVLTSRPLPAKLPPDVVASEGGPEGLLAQLRAANLARDVQLLGGARTIRAFLALGAIDRLGIVVLPVLLGGGIPLFTPGAAPRASLQLDRHRAFPDGAVELAYSPAGGVA